MSGPGDRKADDQARDGRRQDLTARAAPHKGPKPIVIWVLGAESRMSEFKSRWLQEPLGARGPHGTRRVPGSSSDAVTNNIRVEVDSQYSADKSQPFQNQWFFHYTVRISNEGDETVQLLSRHWIITDGTGQAEEIRGPGVVGEQPVLSPGE